MSAKDSLSFIGGHSSPRQKNCHLGGNAFVSCNGFVPVTLCNLCLQKAMKYFISSALFFFLLA